MSLKEQPKEKKTIGLKVISVVMALLLWYYVVDQGNSPVRQDIIEAELQFKNLSDGFTARSNDSVSVRLWGPLQNPAELLAFVDLSGLTAGVYYLPVEINSVRGALIASVEPKSIEVIINEIEEYQLTITPQIVNSPPGDYELLDIIIVPDKCLIRAEGHGASEIKEAVCFVDLSNATDLNKMNLPLAVRDAEGNIINEGIKITPENAAVYAMVSEKITNKRVRVTPEILGEVDPGYRITNISVIPDIITVLGAARQIIAIDKLATESIDINGITNSVSKDIGIVTRSGINAYPSRVTVNIEIEMLIGSEGEDGIDDPLYGDGDELSILD